jgi:hypothetical protein
MIPDEVVLLFWELFAASVFACYGDFTEAVIDVLLPGMNLERSVPDQPTSNCTAVSLITISAICKL